MTPEGDLKKKFRAWMESIGAYRVSVVPNGYGKGYVDDFFCLKGHFIAAEGKAPGKYQTPWDGCTANQRKCLQDVNLAGGFAFAYDNLETAQKIILHSFRRVLNESDVPTLRGNREDRRADQTSNNLDP